MRKYKEGISEITHCRSHISISLLIVLKIYIFWQFLKDNLSFMGVIIYFLLAPMIITPSLEHTASLSNLLSSKSKESSAFGLKSLLKCN